MLAGLERPDAGEVWLGDRLVSSSEKHVFVPIEARKVGMVFQSYALWPHMTVFEQVAYPLRVRRKRAEEINRRVMQTLEMVQLSHLAKRYPGEISGGQQQRVALARALVFEPRVLFLDEPLSNLDAALREMMRLEIARVHHETKTTMIYVTHDQSEALALSDQIILMRLGEIVERGDPQSVYERSTTLYGSQFVGAANCLSGRIVAVDGNEVSVELGNGDRVWAVSGGWRSIDVDAVVTVVARPEDINVDTSGLVPTGNAITGTVRQRAYVGSHHELFVTVGTEEIRVRVDKSWGDHIGERLTLTLPPERIRVFASDDQTGDHPPSVKPPSVAVARTTH